MRPRAVLDFEFAFYNVRKPNGFKTVAVDWADGLAVAERVLF
jgi:hypothetical protein